jgi:hypothetical protein
VTSRECAQSRVRGGGAGIGLLTWQLQPWKDRKAGETRAEGCHVK